VDADFSPAALWIVSRPSPDFVILMLPIFSAVPLLAPLDVFKSVSSLKS